MRWSVTSDAWRVQVCQGRQGADGSDRGSCGTMDSAMVLIVNGRVKGILSTSSAYFEVVVVGLVAIY